MKFQLFQAMTATPSVPDMGIIILRNNHLDSTAIPKKYNKNSEVTKCVYVGFLIFEK